MSSQDKLAKGTKLGFIRHGSKINRYHTMPSLGQQQTVGMHSYNVITIIHTLWPDCRKELLLAAAYHDIPEQMTGDVPSHVKWANPDLAATLDSTEENFLKEHGIYFELTDSEKRMLLLADLMELILYCHEMVFRGDMAYSVPYNRGLSKIVEFRNAPEFGPVAEVLSIDLPTKTDLN